MGILAVILHLHQLLLVLEARTTTTTTHNYHPICSISFEHFILERHLFLFHHLLLLIQSLLIDVASETHPVLDLTLFCEIVV